MRPKCGRENLENKKKNHCRGHGDPGSSAQVSGASAVSESVVFIKTSKMENIDRSAKN